MQSIQIFGAFLDFALMKEIRISGNIYAQEDELKKYGYAYMIRPSNGMGWGLPTRDLTPEDLRKLADHLETSLSDNAQDKEPAQAGFSPSPCYALLIRAGKPSWEFNPSTQYGELVHETKHGNVYAIMSGHKGQSGKPFWIARLINGNAWVTVETEIKAKEIVGAILVAS